MDCSHEPEPDPFGDAFQTQVEMLAIDIRAQMIAVAAKQLQGNVVIHPLEVIDLADVYADYAITGHVPRDDFGLEQDEGEAGEPG